MQLIHGDCLEKMAEIEDGSIDMVLADPPYGTTQCKWDSVIPLEPMWEHLKRVIKPNGATVLFGREPFSSHLRLSNIREFKYDWVWEKSTAANYAQAPYRNMCNHEIISTFSKGGTAKNAKILMNYNPQGLIDCEIPTKGRTGSAHRPNRKKQADYVQNKTGYPRSILRFDSVSKYLHPTQKPVALMEYLIKTYTNEGETVLDFTMGSGTTGVAAKNLKRNFIGIEMDENYFNIAKERIENA